MKRNVLFIFFFALMFSCGELVPNPDDHPDNIKREDKSTTEKLSDATVRTKQDFAIIIHGGAGTILKKNMTPEKEAAYKAKLEEAIRVGYEVL